MAAVVRHRERAGMQRTRGEVGRLRCSEARDRLRHPSSATHVNNTLPFTKHIHTYTYTPGIKLWESGDLQKHNVRVMGTPISTIVATVRWDVMWTDGWTCVGGG